MARSLQEGHAQSEFGLDATVDNFAAGGVMGMTGSMPGQGASFISAESKASGASEQLSFVDHCSWPSHEGSDRSLRL